MPCPYPNGYGLGMTTPSTLHISAARSRGYDRAQTIYKQGAEAIDFNRIATNLYPDGGELHSACLEGLRAGWQDATR